MKQLIGLFLVAALTLTVVPAYAGAPTNGVYCSSGGLGCASNTVLDNRYSISFAAAMQFVTAGNVANIQSYNGALGTQYSISCPEVGNVVLIDDRRINGTGFVDYKLEFGTGTLTLNGTGEAWDGGDATYTGNIDQMEIFVTILYVGNIPNSAQNGNFVASGTFNGYLNSCFNMTSNMANQGAGAGPAAGYPAYLDPTCAATRTQGRWGFGDDITMDINICVVPTEETTWGQIKSLYEGNE